MVDAAALDWIVRLGDPAFEDWDGFTAWLEADPRHAERYHALEADAADLATLVPAPAQGMPAIAPRASSRRGLWISGAFAASVAAIAGYGVLQNRADPYGIETAPGETRTVALADGTSIALNGGSRVILDHRDSRIATLERGEAYFMVRHDADRPFRVKAGEDELLDVGTAFDVARDGAGIRVGVAEGAVLFNPSGEKVRLEAGQGLLSNGRSIRLAEVSPESVGGWRQGTLDYDGAPLEQVSADLSRALGHRIAVAPAIATRSFRGTISLDVVRDDPARLGPLLNVRIRRNGDGWEITPLP
ncbi:MAG: iron dicitrate transport regulator FecR [Sphingomonas sp.]|nr:MAG: iron dicitrate transport regulator FecR [Sphingomonas sp.]